MTHEKTAVLNTAKVTLYCTIVTTVIYAVLFYVPVKALEVGVVLFAICVFIKLIYNYELDKAVSKDT